MLGNTETDLNQYMPVQGVAPSAYANNQMDGNNLLKLLGIGGLAGGLGSMLFGEGPDYSGVSSRLGEIPAELKNYYDPYVQSGTKNLGGLQEQISQLTQDPGAFLSYLGQGYKQSPGYEMNTQRAIEAANRVAAASGQIGSPAEQAAIAQQVYGLGQQDYNNYLNKVLGLYGSGLQGMTGLTNLGAQSSKSLAEDLANVKMSQASAEQARRQEEQERQSSLMGGLGSFASLLF